MGVSVGLCAFERVRVIVSVCLCACVRAYVRAFTFPPIPLSSPLLEILVMLVGMFIAGGLERLMKMDKIIFVINVRR